MGQKKCFLIVNIILLALIIVVHCRDFYIGMFKKNDILVAQDRLYKERVPHRSMQAKYLKVVRCPISYLRIVDRLGVGSGPFVKIIRGGLKKNHIYLYVKSSYNQPLSVAIYIGCPKSTKLKTRTTTTELTTLNGTDDANATTVASGDQNNGTKNDAGGASPAEDKPEGDKPADAPADPPADPPAKR